MADQYAVNFYDEFSKQSTVKVAGTPDYWRAGSLNVPLLRQDGINDPVPVFGVSYDSSSPIAERPDSIDGCMQTWSESFAPNTIRTNMEAAGYVKVRRRTTGKSRMIEASVTLQSKLYDDFVDWYFVRCRTGVLPTYIKRPQDGVEVVARFMEPPAINFIDSNAFLATMKFEMLPVWSKV